jgi:DNA-binding transcriptional regulator YhcF (GntR family)
LNKLKLIQFTGMRIISIIAAFALATVVCADIITSNSGVADATSLQTRRLRGEVYIVRIRRPVDGSISSDDESTSAVAHASPGGDPSTPIRSRKRKDIPEDVEYASGILVNLKNTGNGDDTASTPGTRPIGERKRSQNILNMNNAEKIADVSNAPRKNLKKSTDQERQDMELFLRQRMNEDGSLPTGTITEAAKHFGRHRNTISRIYKDLKPKSGYERVITDQKQQDIMLFLRQRLNADGSLPTGTITEAAKHFGRHRNTISLIYKELKPKSGYERVITDQKQQDIMLFLRQRMNAEGSLPLGTINEAAQHFGRHRLTISRIYNELKPISSKERGISNQERQDMELFLRQRMNAEGSLPLGTINEAAEHFGRHRHTIQKIYKELKSNSAYEHVITDQKRQDIMLFLRQRMNAEGSLPTGTINDAAKHFGRNRRTIERIYKKMTSKSVNEHGAHIDEKTIVPA